MIGEGALENKDELPQRQSLSQEEVGRLVGMLKKLGLDDATIDALLKTATESDEDRVERITEKLIETVNKKTLKLEENFSNEADEGGEA